MTTERFENSIFSSLIGDTEYMRKVIPHIKEEYFDTKVDKFIFKSINDSVNKYNSAPTKKMLHILVEDAKCFNSEEYRVINEIIESIGDPEPNREWMIERTEKWVQDSSIFNAVSLCVSIMDGKEKKLSRGSIPSILSDALSVCFDTRVGHDYIDDASSRWDFYHNPQERVSFDLPMFNKITGGGLPKKTLSIAMAGTNVGKSLFLCHAAAGALKQSKNVLYITLEMAEEKISERIDCNLFDLSIKQLGTITKENYLGKINDIASKTNGKLIVAEYPTSSAHVGHFKSLLNELKTKRNFVPDIIMLDYINLCQSVRIGGIGGSVNSYTFIKAVCEEVRGLAIEFNVPILSATQTNRGGFSNSEVEMTDVAEGFSLAMTVDFMFAIIRNEEMDKQNQLMVKQLKSRFGDVNYYRKFCIGVDISKFKLYHIDVDPNDVLVGAGRTDEDENPFSKVSRSSSVVDINFD